jgi:hypothetical protein
MILGFGLYDKLGFYAAGCGLMVAMMPLWWRLVQMQRKTRIGFLIGSNPSFVKVCT